MGSSEETCLSLQFLSISVNCMTMNIVVVAGIRVTNFGASVNLKFY